MRERREGKKGWECFISFFKKKPFIFFYIHVQREKKKNREKKNFIPLMETASETLGREKEGKKKGGESACCLNALRGC